MHHNQTITTYSDIDWQLLWANSRENKSWKSKDAGDWSKKSATFALRTRHSAYVAQFLKIIDIDSDSTVLDVGCGPGTLAVPYAKKAARVTAIDYSKGMLSELKTYAREQDVHNIKTIQCSWQDNWEEHQVDKHDLVIASRSMNIESLAEGIQKLERFAHKRLVIADRIAPSPYDPDAFAAIGREFSSGPDYIYTVNMLYHFGIHPRIDHIELSDELSFSNLEEAVLAYKWMFRDLSKDEEKKLTTFLASRIIKSNDDSIIVKRDFPQRWAVLSWMKT